MRLVRPAPLGARLRLATGAGVAAAATAAVVSGSAAKAEAAAAPLPGSSSPVAAAPVLMLTEVPALPPVAAEKKLDLPYPGTFQSLNRQSHGAVDIMNQVFSGARVAVAKRVWPTGADGKIDLSEPKYQNDPAYQGEMQYLQTLPQPLVFDKALTVGATMRMGDMNSQEGGGVDCFAMTHLGRKKPGKISHVLRADVEGGQFLGMQFSTHFGKRDTLTQRIAMGAQTSDHDSHTVEVHHRGPSFSVSGTVENLGRGSLSLEYVQSLSSEVASGVQLKHGKQDTVLTAGIRYRPRPPLPREEVSPDSPAGTGAQQGAEYSLVAASNGHVTAGYARALTQRMTLATEFDLASFRDRRSKARFGLQYQSPFGLSYHGVADTEGTVGMLTDLPLGGDGMTGPQLGVTLSGLMSHNPQQPQPGVFGIGLTLSM